MSSAILIQTESVTQSYKGILPSANWGFHAARAMLGTGVSESSRESGVAVD